MNQANTGIYIIETPTNNIYVGQSWDLKTREKQYSWGGSKKQVALYNSFKKYGWDAHKFQVIMPLRDDLSQNVLDYWEQFFIDYYRNAGYVLLNIREGGSYGRHSEESKQKMKDYQSTRASHGPISEDHKKRISRANTGKKFSSAAKEELSVIQRSRHPSEPRVKPKPKGKIWNQTEEVKQHLRDTYFKNHSHQHKLNPEKVMLILKDILANELSYNDIAKKFNISRQVISGIKFGRAWASVTGIKKK